VSSIQERAKEGDRGGGGGGGKGVSELVFSTTESLLVRLARPYTYPLEDLCSMIPGTVGGTFSETKREGTEKGGKEGRINHELILIVHRSTRAHPPFLLSLVPADTLGPELGKGAFGTVELGVDLQTGVKYVRLQRAPPAIPLALVRE